MIAGQIASVAGALALVRVLTEFLSPAEYGQLALALTICTLVVQVITGGIASSAGRFYSIAIEQGSLREFLAATKKWLELGAVIVALIALALSLILYFTEHIDWLGLSLTALGLALLSGYNSTASSIQNAARRRSTVAVHAAIDAWLKVGLAFVAVICFGPDSVFVISSFALSMALVTASQIIFLQRLVGTHLPKPPREVWQPWFNRMWLFSWPLALTGIFSWGYYASQRWCLELFASTADVGKFTAISQIAYTPVAIAGSLAISFLAPIIYARNGTPDTLGRSDHTGRLVSTFAAVWIGGILIAATFATVFHGNVAQIFLASEFRGISIYMPHLIIAAGILQGSHILWLYLFAQNKTHLAIPLNTNGNTAIVALNLISTWMYGLNGLLSAMLAGAALHFAWSYLIFRYHRRMGITQLSQINHSAS